MAHPGGRPTDYKDEYPELAYKFCLLGADDNDLARNFDVSVSTISNWKLSHPEFLEALKAGKEIADAEVSKSLYHSAMGYEHPEDDIRVCDGQIVITPTVKHYPPNATSLIFWLKNRQPKKWRDKREIEAEVAEKPKEYDLTKLDPEERLLLSKLLDKLA